MAVSLRARAIQLLARRECSRFELEQRLIGKGAPRADVAVVLDELIAQGLLSDARYARAKVVKKSGAFGRRRIAEELKAKGVARADIDAALAEAEIDEEAVLRALWGRQFGRVPLDERDRARQVRFLKARGFALSAILRLLEECAKGRPG